MNIDLNFATIKIIVQHLKVNHMKVLIVLAHPEEKSFNAALFQTTVKTLEQQGHDVQTSNLYQLNFAAVSGKENFTQLHNPEFFKQQQEELFAMQNHTFSADILAEQAKIEWCEIMIWQFPLYWFSMPSILKGWVDKVFSMGKFYDNGRIFENGFLAGKKAMLSLTTGGPEQNYRPEKYGDIEAILFPMHRGIFEFLGFSVLKPNVIYSVEKLSDIQKADILNHWQQRLSLLANEM